MSWFSCGELSAGSDDYPEDIFGNESGQLMVIFKVMGTPDIEDITHLDRTTARSIASLRPMPGKVSVQKI